MRSLSCSAIALLLSVFSFSVSAQSGYIGYSLEQRGDPESAVYITEETDTSSGAGVVLSGDPDVFLNASLSVGEIYIDVENITAKINLEAQVLSLLKFNAGVDASINRVSLTIQNVTAKVELEAYLENVVQMIDDVLTSIDLNPLIVTLGQDVGDIVNTTVSDLTGSTTSSASSSTTSTSSTAKRDLDYNIQYSVLYSINDYSGNTHTNRVLSSNGTIYDIYLNNDGHETGRSVVGSYADLMTFTGHNKTISVDGVPTQFQLQYAYTPYPGLEVISNVYTDKTGKVKRALVVAEAVGGAGSTVSDDDEDLSHLGSF